MVLTFVTGPVRSGKTRFAERLAAATGFAVTYVATTRPDVADPTWNERVAAQAARRPPSWRTIETAHPDAPPLEAVLSLAGEREAIVIDTLGTWLADRVGARIARDGEEAALDARALEADGEAFVAALESTHGHAIVVCDEMGWGNVPERPAARVFRDVAGRLHVRLAIRADHSYLVVSGFALDLRVQGRPIDH